MRAQLAGRADAWTCRRGEESAMDAGIGEERNLPWSLVRCVHWQISHVVF